MKELIRRILAATWLLIVVILALGLITSQNIIEVLAVCLMFGLPAWAIQLIALGIVNPLHIFRPLH
jgi:hypothetical protein